ncbi:hypothetical protein ACFPYJ_17755 [Paenibacillus solisilvae]|uniref:DUF4064 domain-containing protein n=1 Tax=Paenibacillus solisilvae TaxID=2486751 RepID=A0ABW0VYB2_9BACL
MVISMVFILITGIIEAVLGIPLVGGIIVIATQWSILGIMFILHLITLILCVRSKHPKTGSILGLAASAFGVVPFLGMVLHIVTAVFLLIAAAKPRTT